MKNPEKWKLIVKKAIKKYRQKPEVKKRIKQWTKLYYQKLKADPIRYKAYLKKRREWERKQLETIWEG